VSGSDLQNVGLRAGHVVLLAAFNNNDECSGILAADRVRLIRPDCQVLDEQEHESRLRRCGMGQGLERVSLCVCAV